MSTLPNGTCLDLLAHVADVVSTTGLPPDALLVILRDFTFLNSPPWLMHNHGFTLEDLAGGPKHDKIKHGSPQLSTSPSTVRDANYPCVRVHGMLQYRVNALNVAGRW